jgi:hypothetical protein
LTFRSLVVCLVSLVLMAVWIEYEELYNTYGGPLAENSPPNAAVGVILVVLCLSALLYAIRRPLRLTTPELVVVYSSLVLAAPLMTQGLWHRLIGLVSAIPHYADFKSYESLPPMLWPHGPNLVPDGCFEQGLGAWSSEGVEIGWEKLDWQDRKWRVPTLSSINKTGGDMRLIYKVPAASVVPGEKFLFTCLVKATGFVGESTYSVLLQADDAGPVQILAGTDTTRPSFSLPSGFQRVGASPVVIPSGLTNRLSLMIVMRGEGSLAVHDVQFFNVEAVEGLYSGRHVVSEKTLASLGPHERDFTQIRPEHLVSPAGLRYILTGGIPWRQWAQPMLVWGWLVGALFIGFLGFNILMRKQWVEFERFTFPLTILPKQLLHQENGRFTILRSRVMWAGVAVVFPLVIWKGLCFYYPMLPAISLGQGSLSDYVSNPVVKAFLSEVTLGSMVPGISFCILAVALLIETDVLLSLWLTFIVFQLWRAFGQAFNFTRYPGYPWEHQQTMGGFIAFALLALFVARHHLGRVCGLVLGRGNASERREAWAYRGAILLVTASLMAIAGWSIWTHMGLAAGLIFFSYMLVCGFAASKIRAEMGAPWPYLTPYYGMQFVAAMGGFAVFSSTGMLVATIAAGFMCTVCFLMMAPVQIEMMELGRHFQVRPRDIGSGLTLGLVGGLVIGGFVVLCWAYGFGVNNLKTTSPYEQNWYFSQFRTGMLNADRAMEAGTAALNPDVQPLNIIHNPDAKGLAIGAGVTLALAGLRSVFTWFPLHPLGYVLAATFFMKGMWLYMFLAWCIRMLMLRLGGARTIRDGLMPFCVGMFLAAVVSIVVFDGVGILLRLKGVVEVYSGIP